MDKKVLNKGKIGQLELKNRFVMPAMDTSMTYGDGYVNDELIAYYAERAKGGFALIITEYTCIDPVGKAKPGQLAAYDDKFIPGLTELSNVIHKYGSKVFLQLQHSGRETVYSITGAQPVAPSAVISTYPGREKPRALSIEDIDNLEEYYSDAAYRAKQAGMDGVEIQAGHGYLLCQFLSGLSNKRCDKYGGSLENRSRIVKEIISKIKDKCGKEFPISVRLSSEEHLIGGLTLQDTIIIAKIVEEAGADAIHVSNGTVSSVQWIIPPSSVEPGFNLMSAKAIKKVVKIPVIAVGRINEVSVAEHAVEDNMADFISLGRASIADPEIPNKIADGREEEIIPCVGCLSRCFYTEGIIPGDKVLSCMVNPFTGHETTLRLEKTNTPKKVVVVGGGPSGLEAAWTAAACGHSVILFERDDVYGGQLLAAAMPPGKHEMTKIISYQIAMCKKYGVNMRIREEANVEVIKNINPDEVILATGASAINGLFSWSGVREIAAIDVLMGKDNVGVFSLIIGGGMVGLETACFLASYGKRVVVVEMKDAVGNDINASVKLFLMEKLRKYNVDIYTSTVVANVDREKATCVKNGEKLVISGIDTVITAIGSRSYNPLEEPLKNIGIKVNVIGDARKPGKASSAIEEAVRTVITL